MANIADSFYSCLCTNIAGIPDMYGMDLYFYKYTLENTDIIIFCGINFEFIIKLSLEGGGGK